MDTKVIKNKANELENTNIHVIAVGDSITYGFPFTHRESWVYLAAERLGISIINKGQCGEITGEIRARFAQDVLAENPTHTIIMGGTNDAFYNIPLELVYNNLYKMCNMAQNQKIKPILGLPIPVNEPQAEEWLKKLRAWIIDFAHKMDYQLLDFYSPMLDIDTGFIKKGCHDDGVHPNIAGYRNMAEVVFIEY